MNFLRPKLNIKIFGIHNGLYRGAELMNYPEEDYIYYRVKVGMLDEFSFFVIINKFGLVS